MKTQYAGINYAGPLAPDTNRNSKTGIRYGVIPQNAVGESWHESSEAYYSKPHCPKCGNAAVDLCDVDNKENAAQNIPPTDEWERARHECEDYACDQCEYIFGSESAYGDEPISHYIDDGEISAECGQDGDIFVMKSPFFTYAQFCSPCAPGACYLLNPLDEPHADNRAYCLGHEWFESGAPYPVYSVATGELVPSGEKA